MNAEDVLAHLAGVGTPPEGESVLRISAGLNRTLRRMREEIFPFVRGGGAELQFVHAPYGRGKTHFLKALAQCAREAGFVTAYIDCQDGMSPFRSIQHSYRAIAASMTPPETGRSFGTSGIARVIEAAGRATGSSGIGEVTKRVRAERAMVPDFRNLVVTYLAEGAAGGTDEDLAERIEALLAATVSYRVTLGEIYRKHRHVLRPLGKLGRRNAAVWLRCLLSLPRVLGYAGTVVLFDETEQAMTGGGYRRRLEQLVHLRTFVDHVAVGAIRGCAVYYTVVEDFLEMAREHLVALSQRIERPRVPGVDAPNPRAVWVDLDELTEPTPDDASFFEELTERIIALGEEAGVGPAAVRTLNTRLRPLARNFAEENIHQGRVRDFVKIVAQKVAQEVRA